MTADIKALTGSLNGGGASTASSSHTTPLPPKHDKMEADIKLSEEPSFDMLVLGCGGGPAENDLSAYWVKPAGQAWNDGFVSVNGGEPHSLSSNYQQIIVTLLCAYRLLPWCSHTPSCVPSRSLSRLSRSTSHQRSVTTTRSTAYNSSSCCYRRFDTSTGWSDIQYASGFPSNSCSLG